MSNATMYVGSTMGKSWLLQHTYQSAHWVDNATMYEVRWFNNGQHNHLRSTRIGFAKLQGQFWLLWHIYHSAHWVGNTTTYDGSMVGNATIYVSLSTYFRDVANNRTSRSSQKTACKRSIHILFTKTFWSQMVNAFVWTSITASMYI